MFLNGRMASSVCFDHTAGIVARTEVLNEERTELERSMVDDLY